MKIKPLKDADFNLVYLNDSGNTGRLTPHCKEHGAMNKFTNVIWRCCCTYGFKYRGKNQYPELKDNNCLAGCEEE